MSFTRDVKSELSEVRLKSPALRQAQAYGMLAFANRYSPDQIYLRTENPQAAERYAYHLRAFTPRGAVVRQTQKQAGGRSLYQVELTGEKDRRALIGRMIPLDERFPESLAGPDVCGAFLAGVFLVCGNVTDPQKRYHLELVVREQPLAEGLLGLLERFLPGGAIARRRGQWVVCYKNRTQIQDFFALVGASKASLAVIEVEMLKEVRNHAMRVTNCETANIDKTVRAAAAQAEDIRLVLEKKGLLALPEELREAALARLENPDLSLRELAGCFESPLSYSAVFRRLGKLSRMAQSIRNAQNGK